MRDREERVGKIAMEKVREESVEDDGRIGRHGGRREKNRGERGGMTE